MLGFLFKKSKPAKKQVNSLVAESAAKDEMRYVYTDRFGTNYYEFQDPQKMSVIRYISATEAVKYCELNLTKESLKGLLATLKKALNNKQPDIQTIGYIAQEIETRLDFAGEKLTLLNLATVYFIREDENPVAYDSKIQIQKLKDWENDTEAESFFLQRAYQLTNNYLNNLDLDIPKYLAEMSKLGMKT